MNYIKGIVHNNKVNIAVLLFIFLAFTLHFYQPLFLYTEDGGFREFGVGYRHKTVFPIWLVIFLMAIFSYYIVLYYLAYM